MSGSARSDSAARYSPAGHPSVLVTSACTPANSRSSPACRSRIEASAGIIARSWRRTSINARRARRRPSGSGGSVRELTATIDPEGIFSSNRSSAWRTTLAEARCASSRTSTTPCPASDPARRAWTCASRSSSSSASWVSHTNSRSSCSDHSDSRLDLPYPGGATITASDASRALERRRTSVARRTSPFRVIRAPAGFCDGRRGSARAGAVAGVIVRGRPGSTGCCAR